MLRSVWECRQLFGRSILFPVGLYPEMGFLDHMVVPLLMPAGASIPFSMMAAPVFVPTGSGGCLFSASSPAVVVSCLSEDSHPSRVRDISLWLCFAFPRWSAMVRAPHVRPAWEQAACRSPVLRLWDPTPGGWWRLTWLGPLLRGLPDSAGLLQALQWPCSSAGGGPHFENHWAA